MRFIQHCFPDSPPSFFVCTRSIAVTGTSKVAALQTKQNLDRNVESNNIFRFFGCLFSRLILSLIKVPFLGDISKSYVHRFVVSKEKKSQWLFFTVFYIIGKKESTFCKNIATMPGKTKADNAPRRYKSKIEKPIGKFTTKLNTTTFASEALEQEKQIFDSLKKYDSIYFPEFDTDLFVVNVVGSYQLCVGFNPKKIAMYLRDLSVKYFAPKFAAATLIIKTPYIPKTTTHCFGTGCMVQIGALSKEHLLASAYMFEHYLKRRFQTDKINIIKFKVTNMVAKMYIKGYINLHSLTSHLGDLAKWERGKFPASRIRLRLGASEVCLVFDTGKLVLTGFKNKTQFLDYVPKFFHVILPFVSKSPKQIPKMEQKKLEKETFINPENLNKLNKNLKMIQGDTPKNIPVVQSSLLLLGC